MKRARVILVLAFATVEGVWPLVEASMIAGGVSEQRAVAIRARYAAVKAAINALLAAF